MDFINIAYALTYTSSATLVAGILFSLLIYRKLDIIHKCIFWYLIAMLISDVASKAAGEFAGNNFFMFLLYSFMEAVLFLVFYFKFLYKVSHKILFSICMCGLAYIL